MSKSHPKNIISVAMPVHIHKDFSYLSETPIQTGCRVLVEFGKQKLVGVCKYSEPYDKQRFTYTLKPILQILDDKPYFSKHLMRLGKWLSSYYIYPEGLTLGTFFPNPDLKATVVLNESAIQDPILKAVFGQKNRLKKQYFLNKLKKHLEHDPDADPKKLYNKFKKANQLSEEMAFDPLVLPEAQAPSSLEASLMTLTDNQESAYKQLKSACFQEKPKPTLLRGITGSGKTLLYAYLIRDIFQKYPDSQVLLMVPEIALTSQMVKRIEESFPNQTAVLHSGLSPKAKQETLALVQHNKKKILIGPRSGVFAPFHKLKLMIVDEEHDGSYKQHSHLPYNGRDVAVTRGHFEEIPIVLGSATPSLESYFNALHKKYSLVELTQRVNSSELPKFQRINVSASKKGLYLPQTESKEETVNQGKSPIAPEILSQIQQTIEKKEQIIIISNRRGYSLYLYDTEHEETILCPDCSVSLTAHQKLSELSCHYCGFKRPLLAYLSTLGKKPHKIIAVGYGCQKIEDALLNELPNARIARLDSDSASKPEYLAQTLKAFRDGELDILLGTQMLAKGHDFPGVTLTVLLELDEALQLPDFKAGERTFQLIVQAAGRTGRGDQPGLVLMQTLPNKSPLLDLAMEHDYLGFIEYELNFRQQFQYPPFVKLALVEFSSQNVYNLIRHADLIKEISNKLLQTNEEWIPLLRLIGPQTPSIERIHKWFRRTLLVLSPDPKTLTLFLSQLDTQLKARIPHTIKYKIDRDPSSIL